MSDREYAFLLGVAPHDAPAILLWKTAYRLAGEGPGGGIPLPAEVFWDNLSITMRRRQGRGHDAPPSVPPLRGDTEVKAALTF